MTNAEKFKEVFGIEIDCGSCNPYPCNENDCEFWEKCESEPLQPCDTWWDWEFKEPKAEDGNDEQRENILDWLYRLRSEIYVYMPKEWLIPMNNALDVAIKALEHPEKNVVAVVPCGDCISREQALVAIRNLYPDMPRVDFNGSLRKWVDKYKLYIECDDAIKLLPSVTPQAKDVPDNNAGEILDKIRAEIKELHDSYEKDGYHDEADALAYAMKVIYKHKAETEN